MFKIQTEEMIRIKKTFKNIFKSSSFVFFLNVWEIFRPVNFPSAYLFCMVFLVKNLIQFLYYKTFAYSLLSFKIIC